MPAQLDPNELVRSSMPLCVALGITGSEATAERVVREMSWRADLCTIGGVVHGGALMALADSSGAVCAFLNLPPGAVATSTIESKTNFLGAVTEGKVVRAVSKPLHAGSTTISGGVEFGGSLGEGDEGVCVERDAFGDVDRAAGARVEAGVEEAVGVVD